MRDPSRMSRPNLEGTGLCRPMGSRGTSPVPPKRRAPMKSHSYNGNISVRRGQLGGKQPQPSNVTSIASLQHALRNQDQAGGSPVKRNNSGRSIGDAIGNRGRETGLRRGQSAGRMKRSSSNGSIGDTISRETGRRGQCASRMKRSSSSGSIDDAVSRGESTPRLKRSSSNGSIGGGLESARRGRRRQLQEGQARERSMSPLPSSLSPLSANLSALKNSDFLDNSFTSCITSNTAFEDGKSTSMDVSAATWTPTTDKRVSSSSMDVSAATWAGAGGAAHARRMGGLRRCNTGGSAAGLRRCNTGGSAGPKKPSFTICGPDTRPMPKPAASETSNTTGTLGALTTDLFHKMVDLPVAGISTVGNAGIATVATVGKAGFGIVDTVGKAGIGTVATVGNVTVAGMTTVADATGVTAVVSTVADATGVTAGVTAVSDAATDLFGMLPMPQLKRNKSAPLDELRASLNRENPFGLADLDKPGRAALPPLERQNSIPLGDLESVASEPPSEEEKKLEESTGAPSRKRNTNDNPLGKPVLKRNQSDPMDAMSSSRNESDFFGKFETEEDDFLSKPAFKRNYSAPKDDFFGDAESEDVEYFPCKQASKRNQNAPMDDFADFSKPAFKRNLSAPMEDFADFSKPALKRNQSAPMEDFTDFSDAFCMEDLAAAPHWHSKTGDDDAEEDTPAFEASSIEISSEAAEEKIGVTKEQVAAYFAAAARQPKGRVTNAAKKGLLAAAQRAQAQVKEARDIEAASLTTKTTLLAAAQRAKGRVQEKKAIEATAPTAQKKLLSAALRAKARVRSRQESDGMSVSESTAATRSRSPKNRRPLRKTKSIPAQCTLDNSFGSHSEEDQNEIDHKRKKFQELSTGSSRFPDSDEVSIDDTGGENADASASNIRSMTAVIAGAAPPARRMRDGSRALNRCKSRSPCRLRRINSNPANLRNLNEHKQAHESTLEARRRERKQMLMDQKQEAEAELGNDDSLAGADDTGQPDERMSESAPNDNAQEEEDDNISPTGVNELQDPAQKKKGGISLSPKSRAKKGIKKIRNLMGTGSKRDNISDQNTDSALPTKSSKHSPNEQAKPPKNRRESFFQFFGQPKKDSDFRQMDTDGEDSLLDLPDLDKMEANMSQLMNNNGKDDSTAGETSSRSETAEPTVQGNPPDRDDARHRHRRSRSRSHRDKLAASSHHTKSRRPESRRESDKTSNELGKQRPKSSHTTRRQNEKASGHEKRKSTDKHHSHRTTSEKKKSSRSEDVKRPDKAPTSSRKRSSKGDINPKQETATSSKRRSSKEAVSSKEETATGSHRRSSKEGRSRRLNSSSRRGMDTSESERSLGLNDLDAMESSHGSYTTSANGSMSASDRSSKALGKSSSSSRSSSLDDSKSRTSKQRSQNGKDIDSGSQGEAKARSSGRKPSTRTSKSLRESLSLDTVPETFNEDDFSEATPRGRKTRKSTQEEKVERSPSASSSIHSTAEISNSDDEFASGAPGRGAPRGHDVESTWDEARSLDAARGRRSSASSVERQSLWINDLGRDLFLHDVEGMGANRHHVSDGAMRHSRRASGMHQFDPRGHSSFHSQQQQSFGRSDAWNDSFHREGNYFHDPRQYPGMHGHYPQDHAAHPDQYRRHGHFPGMRDGFPFGPHTHHGAPHPRGFYGDGRHLSHSNGHMAHGWPHGPHSYYDDPRGRMGFDPRGPSRRGPDHGGHRGGDPFYQPRTGTNQASANKNTPGGECSDQPKREGSIRGPIRRRHSIGSGHDRDAIMQEVTLAMEREMKAQVCIRCNEPMAQCGCCEPIVDISHHTREIDVDEEPQSAPISRDLGGRLTSSDHVAVPSMYDTFGSGYGDPSMAASRMMPRYNDPIDNDMHAGHYHYYQYGPPRPLYRRPDKWDLNDYVPTSSSDRLAGGRTHRGRAMGGVDAGGDSHGNRGPRRSFAADDGSIRYPRRMSFGSVSGRSVADEGSGRSFF